MNGESDIVFGVNPVLEKLKAAPADVEEIIFAEGAQRPALRAIAERARHLAVPLRYLPASALQRLAAGGRHQGVVARVSAYAYADFSELAQSRASGERRWVLLLDGITDPRNFGALLRTAEATGVQDVIIPKDRSAGVSPTVVKASAGAVQHLRVYRVANLRRSIATLKELGFWIVGLDVAAPEAAYARRYPDKLGIVVGSEGAGIRPLILRECDYRVSIPMRGKIASLNVAVAAAMFLYELMRQAEGGGAIDKAGAKR